ncbi:MAG: GMC family oxidoreductase N-terminal domain-containing protein, partial [Elusimicrobia bacterium]|nr:GMC family oxidoreductase N-terminal domain-containing protein [Elusimicrobiota bacterium]
PGERAAPQPDAARAVATLYAHSGLTAGFGNGLFPVAVGRTVGGTTTINSGTCLRPPADAVARWARVSGFDAEGFAAGVEEAWTALGVATVPAALAGGSTKLFFRGLERLGVGGGHLLERAAPGCKGDGRCCFVCPTGAKATAASAFLDQAVRERGVVLRTGARLESAVPAARPGAPVRAVVSCGPEARLESLTCRGLVLACGTLDLRYEGAFVPPEIAPLTMPLEGRRLRGWLDAYSRVASFGWMVRDAGRGSVRHPLGAGLPLIRYDLAAEDARLMARAMRFVARAYLAAGARKVLLPLNRPDNELDSEAALDAFDWASVRPAQLQTMGFHPLGTAGLGRVVGGDLKAAPGVWVCDGSAVPEPLGVNPQITIYALALSLARRLLKEAA